MTPHPQADLLRAIASGEQMQQELPSAWHDCCGNKALNIVATGWGHTIRIKPKTMTLAGMEFPEPMRVAPKVGVAFWVINTHEPESPTELDWIANPMYLRWLQLGLVQATEAGAIAQAKAMIASVGGTA